MRFYYYDNRDGFLFSMQDVYNEWVFVYNADKKEFVNPIPYRLIRQGKQPLMFIRAWFLSHKYRYYYVCGIYKYLFKIVYIVPEKQRGINVLYYRGGGKVLYDNKRNLPNDVLRVIKYFKRD